MLCDFAIKCSCLNQNCRAVRHIYAFYSSVAVYKLCVLIAKMEKPSLLTLKEPPKRALYAVDVDAGNDVRPFFRFLFQGLCASPAGDWAKPRFADFRVDVFG